MSKNKIPSSEVPGARPLPVAGTSPFPGSWRSQARLTQSGSTAAVCPPPRTPGPRPGAAPSSGRARPRAAAAGTAARERKRRPGPASPSPPAARGPCGGRCLRPRAARPSRVPTGLPLPPDAPRRRPRSGPSGSAPASWVPHSLEAEARPFAAAPPATPRRAARRVPDRSRVTWPRAGGGSGPGRSGAPGRAGQSRGGARRSSWMAGAARSAAAAAR